MTKGTVIYRSAIIFGVLVLFKLGCRRTDFQEFYLPFDGDLLTTNRTLPIKSFGATFINYRARKALRLLPDQHASYDLSKFDLSQGTLELWMKVDSPFLGYPISMLRLSGHGSTGMEVILKKRGLLIQTYTNSRIFESANILAPGTWSYLTIVWDAKGEITLYCNGKPIKTQSVSSTRSAQSKSGAHSLLQVGFKSQNVSDPFAICIRDLRILNTQESEKIIHSSFESKRRDERLTWRACDLPHYAGKRIADTDGSGGIAWTTDTRLAALDGVRVPAAGEYELKCRIKPLNQIPANQLILQAWLQKPDHSTALIASKSNASDDFKYRRDSYQDFILKFRINESAFIGYELSSLVPSKATFYLDTITVRTIDDSWHDVRRGEELRHTMGLSIEDAQATTGRAWTNASTLHYGPYVCLGQPGRYRATWRIKIGNIPPQTKFLLLDVFAHDGFFPNGHRSHKTYARLALKSDEFQRDCWETRSMEFHYDGANMLELRAFAKFLQPKSILIDTISVERIEHVK